MNRLRNKLYKYEFTTMILGIVLFIMGLKFITNYPKPVSVLVSSLSNIFIYAAIFIASILIVLGVISAIRNGNFDTLFFILIILAGFYLMYRII